MRFITFFLSVSKVPPWQNLCAKKTLLDSFFRNEARIFPGILFSIRISRKTHDLLCIFVECIVFKVQDFLGHQARSVNVLHIPNHISWLAFEDDLTLKLTLTSWPGKNRFGRTVRWFLPKQKLTSLMQSESTQIWADHSSIPSHYQSSGVKSNSFGQFSVSEPT